MKTRSFLFAILTASTLVAAFAAPADAADPRFKNLQGGDLKRLLGDIVVPAAWSGVWSTVDSTYDCKDVFQSASSGLDTLCTGQGADPDEGEFPIQCSGTVTDNSINMTCTYSEQVDTDCTLTFTITIEGTMTSNSYVTTNVTNLETTGTGKICEFFPGSCTRTVSRGTRVAPEPVAYCATPVDETTWGRVKSRYR